MSDIYKLQYNGMTLAYPGWNGYISFEDTAIPRNVIINQQTGGTIAAAPMSGYDGDVVTLSNTPAAEYNFNSYSITGATLTGNQFAFDGSDVTAQGSFTQKTYTLTLQTDGHGKLVASKTTGHKNDTITLTPSYSSYYRFNNYSITGGTVNGNTFTITADATAKANFKTNTFTASGNFEKGSNVNLIPGSRGSSTTALRFYAITSYHTSNVPTGWYATSKRWSPSNANSYKITLYPKARCVCQSKNAYGKVSAGVSTLIGSTQSNAQTALATGNNTATLNYSKTVTSNTQSTYSISARMSAYNGSQASTACTAQYVAAATSGTWIATGYAP